MPNKNMLAVSTLIKKGLEIYQDHFALLAGYMSWVLLPYAGLVLFSLPKQNFLLEVLAVICSLAQGILALWLGVFLPLIIRELILEKEKIPLFSLQDKAWRLFPSVIFVAILEAAVFLGGLVLLIIPAFIFWVWFALAQFSVILDEKKGVTALSWSRELVRGRFWPIAWRLVAGPVVIGLVAMTFTGVLISIFSLISGTTLDSLLGATPPLWADIISMVIETFSMPLILIYFTLLYLDLTKAKDKRLVPPPQPSPV